MELIARQGYHGTSIKHITDKLGLTKPAIYAHYTGKAEIIHKIIQAFEREYLDQLIECVTGHAGSALDKLHRAISFVSEFATRNLDLVIAFHAINSELKADPEFESALARIRIKQEAFLKDLFGLGIRQGQFKKHLDPEVLSHLFLAFSRGMFQQWLESRNRLDGDLFMRNFREAFFKGLLA